MPGEEGRGPFRGWPHGTVTAAAFQEGSGSAPAVQGTALPCRHLPEKNHSWKGAQGQHCAPRGQSSGHREGVPTAGGTPPAPPHAKGRPLQLFPATDTGRGGGEKAGTHPPSCLPAIHREIPPAIHSPIYRESLSIHPPTALRRGETPSSPSSSHWGIPRILPLSPHHAQSGWGHRPPPPSSALLPLHPVLLQSPQC